MSMPAQSGQEAANFVSKARAAHSAQTAKQRAEERQRAAFGFASPKYGKLFELNANLRATKLSPSN